MYIYLNVKLIFSFIIFWFTRRGEFFLLFDKFVNEEYTYVFNQVFSFLVNA